MTRALTRISPPPAYSDAVGADPVPATGVLRQASHLFPLCVYYEDTDLSGIVYHANHLKFMERARSDLLALLGIDQRAAIEAGEGAYAVAHLSLTYRAPARLGDALLVVTIAREIRAASIRLEQRIERAGTVLSQGLVRVGFVGPDGRPRRQPAAWRKVFNDMFGQ